jgi:uncharacterized membrane-anchored protein YitT (DUF2179 family)
MMIRYRYIFKKGDQVMSLLGDVVGWGLVELLAHFGWYICIIGGIALIVAGIYFGVFILIAFGVTFLIDGIIGFVFEKKFGKDLGGALAGSIFIISFGIMIYLNFFSNIIFLFIGLVVIVLGVVSMLFPIRKYKKAKLKEEKDKKVAEEGKINYNGQIGSTLQIEKKTYEKSIEGVICNYLEENNGKAFTAYSIKNRCEDLKHVDLQEIEIVLHHLSIMGKIASQQKEEEIFYHAF